MRRLRRGEAESQLPAGTEPDGLAGAATPDAPDELPGEAPAIDADGLGEANGGAPAPDPEPQKLSRGEQAPEIDGLPGDTLAGLREAEPTSPTLTVPQLLQHGELAACRTALRHGVESDLSPLVAALSAGETVLRGLGLHPAEGGVSVMLAPEEGARKLLVIFGQDGGAFFLPDCSPDQRVHTLYLRDDTHCLAMLGVDGLGADYDSCLLAILRVARALGAGDLYCLGGGAACYSALRYGLDLGASGVLAAGSLVHLRRGVQAPGLRPGMQARRLMRLAQELGADLTEAYATAATRPGLVLFRPGQVALAGLAALPGAVDVPAPPRTPTDMLGWAGQNGRLQGLMDDLLACRATE